MLWLTRRWLVSMDAEQPGSALAAACARLQTWVDDIIVSAQAHRPTYWNPGELKDDIRTVLAALPGAGREAQEEAPRCPDMADCACVDESDCYDRNFGAGQAASAATAQQGNTADAAREIDETFEELYLRCDATTDFAQECMERHMAARDALLSEVAKQKERVAELDAELARVGLAGASVEGLIRHHRNNEAAAQGAWKFGAEEWEKRALAAEAEVAKLQQALQRIAYSRPTEFAPAAGTPYSQVREIARAALAAGAAGGQPEAPTHTDTETA